jgi:hypothetical protein
VVEVRAAPSIPDWSLNYQMLSKVIVVKSQNLSQADPSGIRETIDNEPLAAI